VRSPKLVSLLTSFIETDKSQAGDVDDYITKMVKFIEKYHKNNETIFWSDPASCHYVKKTLECLEQKNINIVPKAVNPPNLPQAKLIENFWTLLLAVYAKI
jgi:hypothetical protein